MDTCHLINKKRNVLYKFLLPLIIVTLGLIGCQSEDTVDGNFLKPGIYIESKVYWESTYLKSSSDLPKDFNYYGKVQETTLEDMDIPKKERQVTKILEKQIGYKVYISQDKKTVSIFNEEIQRYVYYELES